MNAALDNSESTMNNPASNDPASNELWQRYQDWLYYEPALGFYLDVSRMRFDDAFLKKIAPQFDRAFKQMSELEAGTIANPDESRMVGHYWLRAPELAPTDELRTEIVGTFERILKFVADVHSGVIKPPTAPKFTDILSIGIGGSALGPQFVAAALEPDHPPMQIHFMDNTDPAGFDRVLSQIKDRLNTTLVIIISKSGGTPETRNGMLEVKHAYEQAGLDFGGHAVAVTTKGSKLDQLMQAEHWVGEFPMYDWIGGRTSQLSAVGLLPAALQGINIRAMREGARIMDIATRQPNLKENPAALLAMTWYYAGNGRGEKDMVLLPYKDSLLLFSRYLQQLVMESIGKQFDLSGNEVYQGIAVYGNKGSTDQHAYVQQLREGVPNFFLTFIEVLKDREGSSIEVEPGITSGDFLFGLLQGTREAIYENYRDSVTVTIPEVSPAIVGALIALYERAVGLYGFLVNINSYHQPGVEAGKKAASVVLDLQCRMMNCLRAQTQPVSITQLAEMVSATEDIEMVYKILRHSAANDGKLQLIGDIGRPGTLTVKLG